jgi:hypothetical protein
MGALEKISGDSLRMTRQVSPSFLYYKVIFNNGEFRRILSYRVDNGFGYLLRYVTATWNEYVYFPPNGSEGHYALADSIDIEFYIRRQSRQSNPIPLRCISSPCSAVSNPLSPEALFAQPIGSHKVLNFFYQYGDTVELHLTRGSTETESFTPPAILHLVLKGYNVPEPTSRVW